MSAGIHVFGASSMGALRAAELHQFGMEGVGQIFEAYRDGTIVDDDEVALRHGPADTGYLALSEPLVNIRASLALATEQAVISHEAEALLLRIAKRLFYPHRAYDRIVALARDTGAYAAELARLADWLRAGRVDQKRNDALQMLRRIREFLAAPPKSV